jgi:hypothetical protein
MAEQTQNPGAVTNSFTKGMVKDYNDTFVGEGLWTHARNAVNNSHDGHVGVIGNEPSNLFCINLPYTLIGVIHLIDDQWVVFTTNDIDSEIGIFDESACSYTKVVNAKCLNFKTSNLITGVSRKRYDCERLVYWDDGLNPTRYINVDDPQSFMKYTEILVNDCIQRTYSTNLDCEKIRLASIVNHPCITLEKGKSGGTLANGSYQVCLAYTVDGVRVTDYFGMSEVQSIFHHSNVAGSLEVKITKIDKTFDEFELAVVSNVNQQTVAKRLGYYSTSQGTIYIDSISPELVTIPLTQIALRTEPIEKTDSMYSVNNYLLRIGTYSKFKFNYQKQANQIKAKWVAVEYPSNYYKKGGNNVGYQRDEQYSFFIRWVYNTGEKSESYHIPGREAIQTDRELVFGDDAYEALAGTQMERWKVENTASFDAAQSYTLSDGGRVIGTGNMGYWESTELYPDNRFDIWGDLCGKPIRHHKFPDATVNPSLNHFTPVNNNIVIMGVQFSNITHPLGLDGNPITSIVGYEILRGSREGSKTIIASGLLNNMREYVIPEGTPGVTGLYQNYPFNDLRPDYYLTSNEALITEGSFDNRKSDPLKNYRQDVFSFHSPDTTFTEPFLNVQELKVYGEFQGKSYGYFDNPWKHPKNKFLGQNVEIVNKALQVINIVSKLSNDSFPPGSIELTGTTTMPIKLNLAPKKPEQKKTVLGGILGGIVNIFAPGAGDVVAGVVDGIAYGINLVAYEAQMVVIKYIQSETLAAQMQLLVYGLIPKRQYALQFNSHGFYNAFKQAIKGKQRRKLDDSLYVRGNIQGFTSQFRVNNLYRGNYVILKLADNTKLDDPSLQDTSRNLISDINIEPRKSFASDISSHYGCIKIPLPAQYGQLESIKQIPVSNCVGTSSAVASMKFTSDVMFGGDIYINKFTEKNSMFFFSDWMIDVPDETDYDYRNYINVPFPRYWMNTTYAEYKLLQSTSREHHHLDKITNRFFYIHKGYMYLFNSGVREFFVESEVNVAHRDWGEELSKRHYDSDSFTDLGLIMRSDIIRSGNYYKYDYSLSVSKLYNNFISWGNILPRTYDPNTYSTCYTYRPNRVIYSQPQQEEITKDNWRLFLVNNYKDFNSPVTAIKPVSKNGALFMLKYQSPIQFIGVDQLQTDAGTKITIGDGGLFQQPLQNLVNSDESYEYGSNQNRFASIGTTHGIFWVSQNQGKVFQYAGQLNEISRNGLKWWFAKYLPSYLLKAYPNYPLYDNPVKGVGVQMIYDNTNEIVYITKKDYKPKRTNLLYDNGGFYYLGPTTSTVSTCPSGYTLQGNMCVSNTPSCPIGYQLINGQCVKTETVPAIQSGTVTQVSRTPYEVYGNYGTRIYNSASTSSGFTLLNTNNSFWIRQANPANWNSLTADQKQAFDLNNGPVNRLSIWGRTLSGTTELNNYNHSGANLNPVNQWIGFDVCINIATTKTYYIALAADNEYRFLLDGTLILSDTTDATSTFNYLHIYPVTISAGSHILRLEGRNVGQKAGFGCEVFDLDNRPSGTSVVDFLNAQTNYDNLIVLFTTRNVTQFSSNLFSCPVGFGLANPSCTQPVCQKVVTTAPTNATVTPTQVTVREKIYCNFDNTDCWEDASWTLSYDPKNQMWISFHDWIPSFLIPGKAHFMSVKMNSIWKHNVRCDSYTNFYGIDYPFEVEFVSSTGQQVNSMRNIEYLLEAYKSHNECRDKFHVLDANFDQAIIYNSEQVSGLLELELKNKSNPLTLLTYPQIRTQSIGINYSKEENKYRFNQFWDITKNRGEFQNMNLPMFNTEPNGYKFQINPVYVDYNKSALQRKKFRHNVNKVLLRKLKSNDTKYLFKLSNQKVLQSPR